MTHLEIIDKLNEAKYMLKELQNTREHALATTKIEEAILWLQQARDLLKPFNLIPNPNTIVEGIALKDRGKE
jgi:hypothetical protein